MSVPNPFSLQGKRAVVTGGSQGIGAAVSEMLADGGADVCVGYRSRQAEEDAMVSRLTSKGVCAVAHSADPGAAAGADSLIAPTMSAFGGLDILVHSAGIGPVEHVPVHEMSDERWHRTTRENVDSMFFVSRAAARALGDGGRIVHISSTAGQRGETFHVDYGAAKGAMISFVKSQAIASARRGVTVNCVAPGWVDTEMYAEPFANGEKAQIETGIPNGRVASPQDVAWAPVALYAPGARHLVGEVVNVNSGSVLPG